MSAPSSAPRGERAGTVPVTWQQLARTETVIDDDHPDPVPNRATRRAIQRAARRGIIPDPAASPLRQYPDELRERAEADDHNLIHPANPAEETAP